MGQPLGPVVAGRLGREDLWDTVHDTESSFIKSGKWYWFAWFPFVAFCIVKWAVRRSQSSTLYYHVCTALTHYHTTSRCVTLTLCWLNVGLTSRFCWMTTEHWCTTILLDYHYMLIQCNITTLPKPDTNYHYNLLTVLPMHADILP